MARTAALMAGDLAAVGRWDRESKFAALYSPRNVATGKLYAGKNRDLLIHSARTGRWDSSYWATWATWKRLGVCPNPGERPTRVWFRGYYHSVFCFEQCTVICPAPEIEAALDEITDIMRDRVRAMPSGETAEGANAYRWNMIRTARGERN